MVTERVNKKQLTLRMIAALLVFVIIGVFEYVNILTARLDFAKRNAERDLQEFLIVTNQVETTILRGESKNYEALLLKYDALADKIIANEYIQRDEYDIVLLIRQYRKTLTRNDMRVRDLMRINYHVTALQEGLSRALEKTTKDQAYSNTANSAVINFADNIAKLGSQNYPHTVQNLKNYAGEIKNLSQSIASCANICSASAFNKHRQELKNLSEIDYFANDEKVNIQELLPKKLQLRINEFLTK